MHTKHTHTHTHTHAGTTMSQPNRALDVAKALLFIYVYIHSHTHTCRYNYVTPKSFGQCTSIHIRIHTYIHTYIHTCRYNYVTPKSFLDLVRTFASTLTSQAQEALDMQARLKNGLDKMNLAAEQVMYVCVYVYMYVYISWVDDVCVHILHINTRTHTCIEVR
jgi:hypothetical protein